VRQGGVFSLRSSPRTRGSSIGVFGKAVHHLHPLIPAKAGNQHCESESSVWIPAGAGMSGMSGGMVPNCVGRE